MDTKALKKEAKDHRTSPQRLLELARQDTGLSRLIALRPNLPLEVMRELSRSRDMPTRANLAKNHTAPLEILEFLARDPQWTVAKSVLGAKVNRTVTVSRTIFEIIAGNKRFSVRQTAAESRFCPPDLLERLSRDPAPEVRCALAENLNATAELLHHLAADPDDRVALKVAEHRNTSDQTLDLLAEHTHPHVRQKSIYPYQSFSRKRDIPLERLIKLAGDPDLEVLEYIIRHRHTPTWLVEQILNQRPELFEVGDQAYISKGATYRSFSTYPLAQAVDNHPDLDYALLEQAATVVDSGISRCLQAHPKFDLNLLERLVRAHLEHLSQLVASPLKLSAIADEQKIFKELHYSCTYQLAVFTTLELLPEHLQAEIIAALREIPLRDHTLNQLRKSPFAAVVESAQGRKPE